MKKTKEGLDANEHASAGETNVGPMAKPFIWDPIDHVNEYLPDIDKKVICELERLVTLDEENEVDGVDQRCM